MHGRGLTVERVRAVSEDERPYRVADLNLALEHLGRSPSRHGADQLAALLAQGLDARDDKGKPCQVAAGEALLAMGYPYALELSPKDLEAVRAWPRRPATPAFGRIAPTLFLTLFVQIGVNTFGSSGMNPWLFLHRPWWQRELTGDLVEFVLLVASWAMALLGLAYRAARPTSRVPRRLVQTIAAAAFALAIPALPFQPFVSVFCVVTGAASLICSRSLPPRD